jgi:hypothetical protein
VVQRCGGLAIAFGSAVIACGTLTSNADSDVAPVVDAGSPDAANEPAPPPPPPGPQPPIADSAPPFCPRPGVTEIFCTTFDPADPFKDLTAKGSTSANADAAKSLSSPISLRVAGQDTFLSRSKPITSIPNHLVLEASFYLDALPTAGDAVRLADLVVRMSDTQPDELGAFVYLTETGAVSVGEICSFGACISGNNSAVVSGFTWITNAWTSLSFDVDLSNLAQRRATVTVHAPGGDKSTTLMMDDAFGAGFTPTSIDLRIHALGANYPWTAWVDDTALGTK